ncbi:RNA-directed RNA polymerase [Bienertia sinuspersici]
MMRYKKQRQNPLGHTTDECKNLKNNVEDLIRRGYLQQYKSDKRDQKDQARERLTRYNAPYGEAKNGGQNKGEIHVIFGGEVTINAYKAHLRI